MPINAGKVWQNIVGTDNVFDLESRIFHAFCFLASGMVLLNVPLKLFLGLTATALLAAILFVSMAGSYYLSRYRSQTQLARNLTFASVYILLTLNYYYSGGINGPSLLYFIFTYFAIVCVIPKWELLLWTAAHLFIISLMLFSELASPEIVMYRQVSAIEKTIDNFTAYLCVMALFGTCATFLINSYTKEKNLAKQQLAVLNVLDQERSKLMSIIGHDLRAVEQYTKLFAGSQ